VSRPRRRARDGWDNESLKAEILSRLPRYAVKSLTSDTLSERISGAGVHQIERVLVEMREQRLVAVNDKRWYVLEAPPAFGSSAAGGGAQAQATGARPAPGEPVWRGAVAA
jgi:hypothetical protein